MATQTAIDFAMELVGTKYKYWHPEDKAANVNDGPFWASTDPLPSIETIKASSCNCGGLINLMRRKLGLSIPGLSEGWDIPGGTPAWDWYLGQKNRWEPYDPKQEYPDGTLMFRPYSTPFDQGHLAVKIQGNYLLHSFPNEEYDPDSAPLLEPGIDASVPFEVSQGLDKGGYYKFICRPENIWEKD